MSQAIKFAPVRKSIQVKAPPARAFEVFAGCRWWNKAHSILASRSPQKEVIVEPRTGGRWFERGEDNTECDIGRVLAWDPPRRLLLCWSINGQFQYDAKLVTEVEINFIAEGPNLTRVELEHRLFENAGDTATALRGAVDAPDGWTDTLRRFAQMAEAA